MSDSKIDLQELPSKSTVSDELGNRKRTHAHHHYHHHNSTTSVDLITLEVHVIFLPLYTPHPLKVHLQDIYRTYPIYFSFDLCRENLIRNSGNKSKREDSEQSNINMAAHGAEESRRLVNPKGTDTEDMDEERVQMMVMMNTRGSSTSSPEEENSPPSSRDDPITTSTCPSWKLYENPFYNSHNHHHHHQWQQQQQRGSGPGSPTRHLHRLHLPLSSRKVATSFWDLPFFKPIMDSDQLEIARTQVAALKAEIELERRIRKKAETMSKKLARELSEERRGREAMEKVCEELARELSSRKEEGERMRRAMEEERKMIKVAEVLREERVQMKLTEAKFFFEEKLLELEAFKRIQNEEPTFILEQKNKGDAVRGNGHFSASVSSGFSSTRESTRPGLLASDIANTPSVVALRKASPEPENPHIRRGIKGFVEFPKVVRAIGSKSRHWGTKLECQKAQVRVLLKQRSPIRSSSLIMS